MHCKGMQNAQQCDINYKIENFLQKVQKYNAEVHDCKGLQKYSLLHSKASCRQSGTAAAATAVATLLRLPSF